MGGGGGEEGEGVTRTGSTDVFRVEGWFTV